jgi:transketolase
MSNTQSFADMVAIRDVAGNYISTLGEKNNKVVVVNADLMGTSRNRGFYEAFPDRTFNVGIAEQNLVSFAAGLAHEGFMPYAFTMAPFISMRACEQCRTDVAYGNLNVRLVGNYAGYSSGVSGATHCALEDCAIMGSIAGMTILEPGDPFQICKMLEASLDYEGPIYIRSGIEAIKPIYDADIEYEIGKAIIAHEGNDGAFIASGIVVQFALEAAKIIKETMRKNIRVIDMHTIKPIDKAAVIDAAKTGRIIAAQDHNVIGGLGYYVAQVLAEEGLAVKFKALGAPDHFVPIATAPYLFHKNEYDTDGLVKHMKAMLES